MTPPTAFFPDRRGFLRSAVAGTAIFPALVSELLAAETPADPLAPKSPHFPAKADNVIFLFMSGGVSHVDSFDPKPKLTADHGQLVKLDHPETRNRPGYEKLVLKRPQWEFQPHGKSGTAVSTLFPHVAERVDDIAVIRSMHADHSNHYNATLGMHTGSFNQARPSVGAATGSGRSTAISPRSWSSLRTRPTLGARCGRRTFYPGATRARSLFPERNRCGTFARGFRSIGSGRNWMHSPN
jgi:hypothetical protein